MEPRTESRAVLDRHRDRLLAIPGVLGVSFGLKPGSADVRCVLVHASGPGRPPGLPLEIEGYEVVLVPVPGGFRAL